MIPWAAVIKGAVEAAAVVTAAKTIGGLAKDICLWLDALVGHSTEEHARKVWENFKKDPETYKNDLLETVQHLKPAQDPVLTGYVLGLAKEKLQKRHGVLLTLLSGPKFTFADVESICGQLKLDLLSRKGYSKQDLAHDAVELARTRDRLWDRLISLMLETNPDIVTEIVKLA